MAKTILLPPHLIYVNALPCETQMLQIVTLRGDYLQLRIMNVTEGATRFNNFEVLNIYAENSRQQNSWLMSLKHV